MRFLTDRVAYITGGTRGLGRRLAEILASDYRLVFGGRSVLPTHDLRHSRASGNLNGTDCIQHWIPACAGMTKDEREESHNLLNTSESPLFLVGDVADPGTSRLAAKEIQSRYARLDLFIANAGVACDRPLARTTDAEWDRTIAVDLTGVFFGLRAMAPLLKTSRGMAILIGSIIGWRGAAGAAAYAAAKAGLVGLGLSAAREFAPEARVNLVMPGYLPTEMGLANPAARERARQEHLLGVDGSIDQAARTVAFVATLDHVTGQVFSVDGRIAAL